MRVCIDLDGTICENKLPTQSYHDVEPKPGVVKFIKKLNEAGHEIIIYTARGMATYNKDVDKIIEIHTLCIENWFKRLGIRYDEIYFGKPLADVYIDDRALAYTENTWRQFNELLV